MTTNPFFSKLLIILSFMFHFIDVNGQENEDTTGMHEYLMMIDSIENSFTFQYGKIELPKGNATIEIPKGYKFLSSDQAERVITDLWGNPEGENLSLGMILREDQKLLEDVGYVFNIQYEAIGYVKDDDADDIDYDELLVTMKEEMEADNIQRVKNGYEPVSLIGWASEPHYDAKNKILHWAKEAKFGDSPLNTLNYNIRFLGRKGVIVLNAIGGMSSVNDVKRDIPEIVSMVQFTAGNTYAEFNPEVDEVAAWTLGGLVAGKVLAKVGFFTLLVKMWKVIAIAVAGAAGVIWKRIKNKRVTEG